MSDPTPFDKGYYDKLWFACHEPERPTDPYVIWHYKYADDDRPPCQGCIIKLKMVEHTYGEGWPWLMAKLTGETRLQRS